MNKHFFFFLVEFFYWYNYIKYHLVFKWIAFNFSNWSQILYIHIMCISTCIIYKSPPNSNPSSATGPKWSKWTKVDIIGQKETKVKWIEPNGPNRAEIDQKTKCGHNGSNRTKVDQIDWIGPNRIKVDRIWPNLTKVDKMDRIGLIRTE